LAYAEEKYIAMTSTSNFERHSKASQNRPFLSIRHGFNIQLHFQEQNSGLPRDTAPPPPRLFFRIYLVIYQKIIEADGSEPKQRVGGNATTATSFALADAAEVVQPF
jgi:hypothetical protein